MASSLLAGAVFALGEADKAHRRMETSARIGKIGLTV